MRKLFWLITGIGIGFVAAHFVNQSPEGRRFFERVNQGAREFGDAVASGYHEVESAAGEALDDVEKALRDLDGK